MTKLRLYILLGMRSSLIKELHKSKEFRYLSIEEIVRRLAKVFTIP